MKLEDFVEKENYDLNNACLSKSFHVIGNCLTCKYWIEADDKTHWCDSSDENVPEFPRSNFGCLHWEEKDANA